ncbi:MAG: transporter substrate-binding domain-containing protein [Cognaticolwellia sp.]
MKTRLSLLLMLILALNVRAKEEACQFNVRVESTPKNLHSIAHNTNQLSRQSYAILAALLAKIQCKLVTQPLPFPRALKMLESGTLNVISGMSKTQEREKFSYFIGPYHHERIVVIGNRALKNKANNLAQLLQLDGLISATDGAYYGEQWLHALQTDPKLKGRIIYLSENQKKFSMLFLNRVAISLEDERVVDEYLAKYDVGDKLVKLFIVHEDPVYFAFSKKAMSTALYEKLSRQWRHMVNSDELSNIKKNINSDH